MDFWAVNLGRGGGYGRLGLAWVWLGYRVSCCRIGYVFARLRLAKLF